MTDIFKLKILSPFTEHLPADPVRENYSRQVYQSCFSWVETRVPSKPAWVHMSQDYMKELGLRIVDEKAGLQLLTGAKPFPNFQAYAMCYGGHQFGNWAGQLGDGRAIIVADVEVKGGPLQFQLKGAGSTPYSRGSDGLAVLRSSIREYLCSEAMHHLGIPTTRALSLAKTGDWVTRDILYNGNPREEHGAVVCRVAPSFIRFGNFQIFASRGETAVLKKLVDHTIITHFPHLGTPSTNTYIAFFKEVAQRTCDLIVHWQRVGFVHGVMNTDNLSILGLTIDYGPYGWLEDYNPGWTPNTTDAQQHRYRYGNQPYIGLWNLAQLGNALYPLIGDAAPLQAVLDGYRTDFTLKYHKMMAAKVGLYCADEIPESFIEEMTALLQKSALDMTIFFRELSNAGMDSFNLFQEMIKNTTYHSEKELIPYLTEWKVWHDQWVDYLEREGEPYKVRQAQMRKTNPKYVLRNYMAQLAIDAAEKGDYSVIGELYQILQHPYDEQPEAQKWYAKRPEWAKNKVGCSMLSCSS